jgi:hypothetical protein
MLGVSSHAPRSRRQPLDERDHRVARAAFDPASSSLGVVLVRRIADHDGDRLGPFDAIGGAPGLGQDC